MEPRIAWALYDSPAHTYRAGGQIPTPAMANADYDLEHHGEGCAVEYDAPDSAPSRYACGHFASGNYPSGLPSGRRRYPTGAGPRLPRLAMHHSRALPNYLATRRPASRSSDGASITFIRISAPRSGDVRRILFVEALVGARCARRRSRAGARDALPGRLPPRSGAGVARRADRGGVAAAVGRRFDELNYGGRK